MNKYMRKDLQFYKPYHSPIKPYEIKVDANESPYPHHEAFVEHMKQWMKNKDNITRYPDTDAVLLRRRIAKHYEIYNVHEENVICGVGSDQIIDIIIKVFVEPGETILAPTPSFSMYKLGGLLNHAYVHEYALDDEFHYDISALLDLIEFEAPKLVFLCTPNNPTGGLLDRASIIQVLDKAKCPVVIDEVYAEFSGETMLDLFEKYPNMIILRSFSKAYGLAGLRTGYAIANKEMIDTLYIGKPPYNLSNYSQEASIFVLDHHEFYMDQVQAIKKEREIMKKHLETLPFVEKVYESETNFLLIKVERTGIQKLLEEKLILIRDYPPTGNLAGCIRITIGTSEENQRILEKLREV